MTQPGIEPRSPGTLNPHNMRIIPIWWRCLNFVTSSIYLLSIAEFDIKYQVGWLVGFYGISTFVGYLIPNPFPPYIKYA